MKELLIKLAESLEREAEKAKEEHHEKVAMTLIAALGMEHFKRKLGK